MKNLFDICIFTLGCKVNQTEGFELGERFLEKGFTVIHELQSANNYIINTCSVTQEADSKSRQCISRALKQNKDAKIFVIGCASEFDKSAFEGRDNVELVVGAKDKSTAFEQILPFVRTNVIGYTNFIKKEIKTSRRRAYIKIQDGCDNYCSYCIVPYLRGASTSKPLEEIILEAKNLEGKVDEIAFTGICISDYKIDGELSLKKLIAEFQQIKIPKKFIGSLTPTIVDEELLRTLSQSGFCPPFHLSVQSGSDTVLRRMNRNYAAKEMLEKIDLIRRVFPKAEITADIIAGFPKESEMEFNETLEFIKQANFTDIHAFPYSAKKGTVAEKLPQLPMSLRKERVKIIKNIHIKKT
ncbi:MAG: MiaB/RimO family radical SAM methylthiotransferase [Firmicutes bacterium]|nr:MiaB/RimO family radical SAM methylthiotransferase [Bacillota bacterium]